MIKFLKFFLQLTIGISGIPIVYLFLKINFEYFKESINKEAGLIAAFFSLFFFYCFVIGFSSLPIILRLRSWLNDGEFSNSTAHNIFNSVISNVNQTITSLIESNPNLKLFEDRMLLDKLKDGLIIMTTLNILKNLNNKGIFKSDDSGILNNEYYGLKYSLMRELQYWDKGIAKKIEGFMSNYFTEPNLGLLTFDYILKDTEIKQGDKLVISYIKIETANIIGAYINKIVYEIRLRDIC